MTLALSLTAIKQDITAQCAWVDATNLATLPPIVNPADNSDSDTAIRAAVNMICNRLSGYIVDTSQNDDVFTLTINLPKLPNSIPHSNKQITSPHYFVINETWR